VISFLRIGLGTCPVGGKFRTGIGTPWRKRTEGFPMYKARKSLWYIINAAKIPRMTAQQPSYGEIGAFDRTEALNRLHRIRRASGIKAAARWLER
jgi:hypothetical protein